MTPGRLTGEDRWHGSPHNDWDGERVYREADVERILSVHVAAALGLAERRIKGYSGHMKWRLGHFDNGIAQAARILREMRAEGGESDDAE